MVSKEIIFFELCNEKGISVARSGDLHNLPENFTKLANENFSEKGLKNVYRKTEEGSVHLIINTNSESFQGSKAIKRACLIYLSLIPKFKQIEAKQRQSFDAIVRRFSHNLIKFQKRFKDNFDRLISDKARARPYNEFKDEVQRRINENISSAANDVCQMSHRAIDLDAQIETLRIIGGYADNSGTFLPTNLKRAMYRLTNPFIDELEKRDIKVVINIEDTQSSKKVIIVHSLFNAAIWQLLDNASKYALSNSVINITADLNSKPQKLLFMMTSISIEADETEKIFIEHYQGRNTKKEDKSGIGKDGSGIGMYIVKKALGFMKARVNVSNKGFEKREGEYPYSKHIFEIEFNG